MFIWMFDKKYALSVSFWRIVDIASTLTTFKLIILILIYKFF